MKFIRAVVYPLLALGVCSSALASPITNVALNAKVSITGTGFSSSTAAILASVTDGTFLADGTQWHTGTLNWSLANPVGVTFGVDARDSVKISLAAPSWVNSITLQTDNKDAYAVQYLDATQLWQNLTTMTTIATSRSVGGMSQGSIAFTPILASAFRITASGDGLYALSEFQAYGSAAAVPEPAGAVLLLTGLVLMGVMVKRKATPAT